MCEEAEEDEDAHGQTATTTLGAWLVAGGKGRASGRQGALLPAPHQPHLLPRLSASSVPFFFIIGLTLVLVSSPVSWTPSSLPPGSSPILSTAAGVSFLKPPALLALCLPCLPTVLQPKLKFLLAFRTHWHLVLSPSFSRPVLGRVEQAEGRAGAGTELLSGRGV